MISQYRRQRIKSQSKTVADYMERESYIPDYIPGGDALPVPVSELHKILDKFFQWFSAAEGYGHREERFWQAIEYQDDREAFRFLKTAWVLGYKAGQASVPKDNL